jgi:subtilase family serine protease
VVINHFMNANRFFAAVIFIGALALARPLLAGESIRGAVPEAVGRLQLPSLGRVPGTNQLRLAIGFPVRDQEGLASLLKEIYQPGNPHYRHYLTPQQFAEQFGPTEQDYQSAIEFANAHGLEVAQTHGNRLLLDVTGSVSKIEETFHITLNRYRHPTENREFYAPTADPTPDLAIPILQIDGLNNYAVPVSMAPAPAPHPQIGSGPSGDFAGQDFRNAYAPGVTETGTGQMVGLMEFDGYFASDVTDYESSYGLAAVPLVNVAVDGSFPAPGYAGEAPGDIEMVISMATNLSAVVVFGSATVSMATWNDVLNSMASSNQIKQFSCSYRLSTPDAVGDEIFQEMGVQGQSFFKASGDGDAYVVDPIPWPNDDPYITLVGGTELSMSGTGAAYSSETVYNTGLKATSWGGNGDEYYWGSGGGVSSTYPLPDYQSGTSMSLNGGSTTMRNLPDVAMVAYQIEVYYGEGGLGQFGGTSFASPLWAGFMALANERIESLGLPSVGFANPLLYTIGNSPNYPNAFHDITTGSNSWPGSGTNYPATIGYDLCTGWGSPNGINLINALVDEEALATGPTVSASLSGNKLTLISSRGVPGAGYTLLATTNLALPISKWNTNSTGVFGNDGTSTSIVKLNQQPAPDQYFQIRIP